jgi:hypothetical protein
MRTIRFLSAPRRALRRPLLCALVCFGALGSAHAQPPACALEPADLEKAFGLKFEKGKEVPGGPGTGCYYEAVGKGSEFKVFLGIIPTGGQMQMFRTMLTGGGELIPVPGDPDKAAIVKHRSDVSPFPDIMYERGDLLVQLHASAGVPTGNAKADAERIEKRTKQLLKVRRVP